MSTQQIEESGQEPDAEQMRIRQQLFATLYNELHRLARRELRRQGPAITLGPTALLHEMYLSVHGRREMSFPDKARFLAYACRAMRGLVVDYMRHRKALKRGGAHHVISLPSEVPEQASSVDLERLSDAVERLAAVNPKLAELVDLKYFSGFSFVDIAALWGISERSIQREWGKARLFLQQCLSEDGQLAPLHKSV